MFYLSPESLAADNSTAAYWEIAPDLVVEIMSPSDTAALLREKVEDYLSAGTKQIWIVVPDRREVVVHTPDGAAVTLSGEDRLAGGDVLPGFDVAVSEFFV